jgi:hypothetical protein
LKCSRCGSKEIRIRSGIMICKKGHRVTVQLQEERVN